MIDGQTILDESIRLAREFEEFRILAFALGMKAQAMGTSVTWEVIDQMNEAISLSRRNGYAIELLMLLFSAGRAYIAKNELVRGKEHVEEALHKLEEFDVPYMNAWAYLAHANLAAAFQDIVEAKKYLLLASDTYGKLGDQRLAATTRSTLAHIYRNEGRLNEALGLYRQTILAWQEQGHQSAVAHQLECFAYIAMAGQQYGHAAQLLGAAQSARERLNAHSTDLQEVDELGRAMSQLEVEMGASEMDRMIKMGELMSLDGAVAFALQEI